MKESKISSESVLNRSTVLTSVLLTGALGVLIVVQIVLKVDIRWLTGLAFVATTACWILIVRAATRGRLAPKVIAVGLGLTALVCVALPPGSSTDVNSYAMYGHMVANLDASPYLNAPEDFPGDPWLERVSPFWADSPSVYGPVFTYVSAAVLSVTDSFTGARIGFQLIALASYLAVVALLWFRTKRLDATLLFAANPIVLAFGINDAHCDLLLGLLVLAAVPLLDHKRWIWAGVLIGLAVLIKISAIPVIAGAFIWALGHKQVRGAIVTAATSVVVSLAGLASVGIGNYLQAMSQVSSRQSRFSVWSPFHGLLDELTPWAPSTTNSITSLVALASVAVVGLLLIWKGSALATSAISLTGGLVAYQVVGAYTLAWYVLWALPALALLWALDRSDNGLTRGQVVAVIAIGFASWTALAYFSGYFAVVAIVGVVVAGFRYRHSLRLAS